MERIKARVQTLTISETFYDLVTDTLYAKVTTANKKVLNKDEIIKINDCAYVVIDGIWTSMGNGSWKVAVKSITTNEEYYKKIYAQCDELIDIMDAMG